MADATLQQIQRALGQAPEQVFGGGPPHWAGHGRTYRIMTPSIDVDEYNEAVATAQEIGQNDQIDLFDIPANSVAVLNSTVVVEDASTAACVGIVRIGTTAVHSGIALNSVGGKSSTPSAPVMGTVAQTVNIEFTAASPAGLKFRLALLMLDLTASPTE